MSIKSFSLKKITSPFFRVAWIVVFLTLCVSCDQAAVPAAPDELIRTALIEHLNTGTANLPLQESTLPPATVRATVHDNLDPGLLKEALEITGTDFRFVPSGQKYEAQVAIMILTYPDETTAFRMTEKLSNMGGYFRRTKILTPFSYAMAGDLLAIVFTENAGDEYVVKFINDFPKLLKTEQ